MKRYNLVTSAPKITAHRDEWEVFDALPRSLRHALHEAVVDWEGWRIGKAYGLLLADGMAHREAVDGLLRLIREKDEDEVAAFCAIHRKRHGVDTPHVRAMATIQRFGARAA